MLVAKNLLASDASNGPYMKSFLVLLLPLVVLLSRPASVPAQNPSPNAQANAVAAVKKIGGVFCVDSRSGDLSILRLIGWRITDEGLVHLKSITSLESLDLGNTRITDAGLEHLKGLNLIGLDFNGTQVTDMGLPELKATLQPGRVFRPEIHTYR